MSSSSRPRNSRRDHPTPSRRHVRPPGPLLVAPGAELTPDHIDGLLTVLGGLDTGSLVIVQPDRPGHMTLGVRELPADPRCAGAGLFGLDVPTGCSLIAASFIGRCSSDGDAGTDGGAAGGSAPTRVDALVTALGDVHARVRHGYEPPQPVVGAPSGVMVDAMHRAIRLPSPGSPPPLTELVGRMWLHRVLGLPSPAPTWSQAATTHLDPGRSGRPRRGGEPTTDEVVDSILELADDADWRDLHRAAAIGRMAVPELDPLEADWMDHTMFARWMVESFRSTDVALAMLRSSGADATADRIDEVLSRIAATAPVLRRGRRGA